MTDPQQQELPPIPAKFPCVWMPEAGTYIDISLYLREAIENRDDEWRALAAPAPGGEVRESSVKESLTVPPGWKLVPIEPTREMWDAVNKLDDKMAAGGYDGKGCSIEQAWGCLVESAPTAPFGAAPETRHA